MAVDSLPSTDFQIPVLPCGRELVVNIISTWCGPQRSAAASVRRRVRARALFGATNSLRCVCLWCV
jgi:hypothetical protein